METSQATQSTCPQPEEIGAYLLDHEGDAHLGEHLRTCAKCQQVADEYRQLDVVGAQCFRPQPGLASRIQTACLREAERAEADALCESIVPPRNAPRLRWHAVLATAAALVAVAVLSALTTAAFLRPRSDMPLMAEAEIPNSQQVISVSPAYRAPVVRQTADALPQIAAQSHPGFSLADSRRLQLSRRHRDEAMESLAKVSSDARRVPSGTTLRQLALLPEEIEQVWIASDLLSAQEFVQQTQREHPEILAGVSEPDDQGIVTLRLQATDLSVQELADILYQHGKWTLLSANYPQPGRGAEVAFQEQPTRYTLKILTK